MIGPHQTENRARGWVGVTLRWVGALAVLGILFHFLPLQLLSQAIRRVPVTRFVAILIGYLLAHCVGIAKWRMVVNAAGAQLDYRTCVQCYTGGLFATLFLPSIIGGDVVRLAVGLRRSPNPAAVLAGNVLDRFLDMTAQGGLVLSGTDIAAGIFARVLRKGGADEHLRSGRPSHRGGFVEPDVRQNAIAGTVGEFPSETGALAVRATSGMAEATGAGVRLDARYGDSIHVPDPDGAISNFVRVIFAASCVVLRMAAGKVGGVVAVDTGRDWSARSGVGGPTVPIWSTGASCVGGGARVGRRGYRGRAHCGPHRICAT